VTERRTQPHEDKVPSLPDYLELIAQRAAQIAIENHAKTCPIKELEPRVRKMEVRFSTLIGIIVGAGGIGGGVSGAIVSGAIKLMASGM
jgi:hypothetical protein